MEKTRKYYVRHWSYIIIGRKKPMKEYAEFTLSLDNYRKNVDFGLYAESFTKDGFAYSVLVIMRTRKPLRYDTVAKAFKGYYITRVKDTEKPSDIVDKWRMKYSKQFNDIILVQAVDKKHALGDWEYVDDEYQIKFDEENEQSRSKK